MHGFVGWSPWEVGQLKSWDEYPPCLLCVLPCNASRSWPKEGQVRGRWQTPVGIDKRLPRIMQGVGLQTGMVGRVLRKKTTMDGLWACSRWTTADNTIIQAAVSIGVKNKIK